jgi:hypothetical protein
MLQRRTLHEYEVNYVQSLLRCWKREKHFVACQQGNHYSRKKGGDFVTFQRRTRRLRIRIRWTNKSQAVVPRLRTSRWTNKSQAVVRVTTPPPAWRRGFGSWGWGWLRHSLVILDDVSIIICHQPDFNQLQWDEDPPPSPKYKWLLCTQLLELLII